MRVSPCSGCRTALPWTLHVARHLFIWLCQPWLSAFSFFYSLASKLSLDSLTSIHDHFRLHIPSPLFSSGKIRWQLSISEPLKGRWIGLYTKLQSRDCTSTTVSACTMS
ncbi:hypothetical protein GQ53DRAFT_238865 [Thozetella sp. PMI_491]|nr:hypothetical protein GQ53DRAFT_238865 [Thozetella sp. PMI_491]